MRASVFVSCPLDFTSVCRQIPAQFVYSFVFSALQFWMQPIFKLWTLVWMVARRPRMKPQPVSQSSWSQGWIGLPNGLGHQFVDTGQLWSAPQEHGLVFGYQLRDPQLQMPWSWEDADKPVDSPSVVPCCRACHVTASYSLKWHSGFVNQLQDMSPKISCDIHRYTSY